MIRRDVPLGSDAKAWLCITQPEHARLSYTLASAWRDLLPAAPADVREELLKAILHHDDGWAAWEADPKIDPEHGRPYGFTEMPPHDAQTLWSKSIDACGSIGPLAAATVASHFIALQSKQDDDYDQWRPWLAEQDVRREAWLADWHRIDPQRHTEATAERCVYLLQHFDWLSLWLCCQAPLVEGDDLCEPLVFGSIGDAFGPFDFRPEGEEPGKIRVSPWPFRGNEIEVKVCGTRIAAERYDQMPAGEQETRRIHFLPA